MQISTRPGRWAIPHTLLLLRYHKARITTSVTRVSHLAGPPRPLGGYQQEEGGRAPCGRAMHACRVVNLWPAAGCRRCDQPRRRRRAGRRRAAATQCQRRRPAAGGHALPGVPDRSGRASGGVPGLGGGGWALRGAVGTKGGSELDASRHGSGKRPHRMPVVARKRGRQGVDTTPDRHAARRG